ncbi:MAG: energy-coupled thiamine transporter ThiT [Clostridia bacterium]|nr:energy-coupled thiamine transporter ThiT [Clostridia bacterium]
MESKTLRLVECALMVAISVALSYFTRFFVMPLGGSITICGMLPVLLAAYRHGIKWGLATGFVFAVIELILDIGALSGWGLTPQSLVGSLFFDYLIAFTCLGFAGIYGRGYGKMLLGMTTAVLLRLVSHVISGAIFFASWMPKDWAKSFVWYIAHSAHTRDSLLAFTNNVWLYSVAYNALFLIPDLVICLIVASALYKPLKKYLA